MITCKKLYHYLSKTLLWLADERLTENELAKSQMNRKEFYPRPLDKAQIFG